MAMELATAVFSYAIGSLLQIDEMQAEPQPDGTLRVVFVTTGVHPSLAKIKTAIWAIFGLPVQTPEDVTIEELQSGPVLKRYRITVILRPVHEKLKKGEGLGLIDVVTGRNVHVIERK